MPLATATDEVVAWNLDTLTRRKTTQVVVERCKVDSLKSLEVGLATIVERRLIPIDEVVIQSDKHRVETEDAQLHTESL